MNRPRRNPPVIVANEMVRSRNIDLNHLMNAIPESPDEWFLMQEMIDSDDDSVSEPVLSMASKRSTGSTKVRGY